jgi:hypothetical protein
MAYTTPDHLLLPHLLTTLLPIPFIIYFTITFTSSYIQPCHPPTPRQTRIKLYLSLTSLFYLAHLLIATIAVGIPLVEISLMTRSTELLGWYLHSAAMLFRFIALATLFPALGGEAWCVCLPPSWRMEDGILTSRRFDWAMKVLLVMMVLLGGLGAFFVNVPILRAAGEGMAVMADAGVLVAVVGVLTLSLNGLVVGVIRERRRKERMRRSLQGVGMRVNPMASEIQRGQVQSPGPVTTDTRASPSQEVRGGRATHERVVSTISVETTQTYSTAREEVEHDEEIAVMDKMLRKRKRHMLLRIGIPAVMLVAVLYVAEAAGMEGEMTKEGIVKEVFGFVGWCLVLAGFRMGLG